jgi:hypothetical protein
MLELYLGYWSTDRIENVNDETIRKATVGSQKGNRTLTLRQILRKEFVRIEDGRN